MSKTLRDSAKVISPSWLRGFWGERFVYAIALQLDALWDWVRQGVRAALPGYGPSDALPSIGNDVQIFRGPNEPEAAYVDRLQRALPTWKKAGGAPALLAQIQAYFSPDPVKIQYIVNGVDENDDPVADWTTLDELSVLSFHRANPSNWDWDGDTTQIRFWIVVYLSAGVTVTPKLWGDGHTYGDGTSWGYVETVALATDIRNLIHKWKAAGSHAWRDGGIILVGEGGSQFDPTDPPGPPNPDGTWGDPANRTLTAFYLSGI